MLKRTPGSSRFRESPEPSTFPCIEGIKVLVEVPGVAAAVAMSFAGVATFLAGRLFAAYSMPQGSS